TSIEHAYNQLTEALEKLDLHNINIDFSAEHMIDDNFETILVNGEIIPLKNEYLLVEMSYLQPSINFDVAITKISEQQFYPILAHPERYVYFHNRTNVYKSLKNQGVLFQMNLLSLTSDVYGKAVQKCAYKLLEDGMIDFIASDVHNVRQLSAIKEVKISNSMLNRILPVIENTIRVFY
ncbi:MAG: CpsB/CapC family capsule biosynthesis tyrosine phosphatase, partial [Allomuricauda sp.]